MNLYLSFSLVLFILHWVLLIAGRKELQAKKGDANHDPLYKRWTVIPAALGLFITQLAGVLAWSMADNGLPNSQVFAAGTLFFSGFALRLWAHKILGRFFTFDIGIREGHKILKEGPYRLIRHPSYTGYFLLLVGLCLSYPYWFFLPLLTMPTLGFFLLRIHSEEKMLVAHFGEDYRSYQRHSKKLIPFLF